MEIVIKNTDEEFMKMKFNILKDVHSLLKHYREPVKKAIAINMNFKKKKRKFIRSKEMRKKWKQTGILFGNIFALSHVENDIHFI